MFKRFFYKLLLSGTNDALIVWRLLGFSGMANKIQAKKDELVTSLSTGTNTPEAEKFENFSRLLVTGVKLAIYAAVVFGLLFVWDRVKPLFKRLTKKISL